MTANKVQKTAALHPRSVTKLSADLVPAPERPPRIMGRRPVDYHLKPDPRVEAAVRRILAEGSYTRARAVPDPTALDGVAVIVR